MSKIHNTQKYALSMAELWKNSEDLMKEVDKLLREAENTSYEGRTFTYTRGGPGGWLPFRNASEKAWIALSQVTDILIDSLLHRIPKGHYDRRLALREVEAKWPELKLKNFYDKYGAMVYYIRNNSNYYSMMDLEMLRFEVGRLQQYMDDIKSVITKK